MEKPSASELQHFCCLHLAGLTEEYSMNVDGVRQNFILETAAQGPGTRE